MAGRGAAKSSIDRLLDQWKSPAIENGMVEEKQVKDFERQFPEATEEDEDNNLELDNNDCGVALSAPLEDGEDWVQPRANEMYYEQSGCFNGRFPTISRTIS